MKDDRGELDLTKQVEDKDELIKTLRQRINELMAINKSHQQLMGKQIQENEELKTDNKRLAKQIDDYFNVRVKAARDNAG
jgi:regulator of replication initiation timing